MQAAQAGPVSVGATPIVAAPTTDYAGRTAAPSLDKSSEFTDLQRQAALSIQGALSGQAPSLAELQSREAASRGTGAQLSLAAGARGRSVAAANRTAATQIAQIRQNAAAQGAQLRAQEQAQARGELASLGTAARGQDIQLATTESGQKLAADLASDDRMQGVLSERAKLKLAADQGNQDAQVKLQSLQASLDSEMERFNAAQLQNASAADAENYLKALGLDDAYTKSVRDQWLELERLGMTEDLEKLKLQVMERIAVMQDTPGFWDKVGVLSGFMGGIGQAVGGAAKASDRRVKVNVAKLEGKDLDAFLQATRSAFEWDYSNPAKHGEGRHHGPMAQDIQKSKLGRTAVIEDQEGVLNLDFHRLAALALMGLGRLDERVSKMEGSR